MTTRLTIGLETHEVDQAVADAFAGLEQRLDTANQQIATLRAEGTTKDQRLDAAHAELRGGVRARVTLEREAAKQLGENERLDSLSDRAVRERALKQLDPKATFEGRSDDYVMATFDALVVNGANKINRGLVATMAVVSAAETSRADALRAARGDEDDEDDDSTESRFDVAVSRYRNSGTPTAQED